MIHEGSNINNQILQCLTELIGFPNEVAAMEDFLNKTDKNVMMVIFKESYHAKSSKLDYTIKAQRSFNDFGLYSQFAGHSFESIAELQQCLDYAFIRNRTNVQNLPKVIFTETLY